MAIICPAVLAEDKSVFERHIARIKPFATRIQVDLMDGVFAPTRSVSPSEISLPDGLLADIHLMYAVAQPVLADLLSLRPHMIILHAEARDFAQSVQSIRSAGIKVGVAILPDTPVSAIREVIGGVSHILLFAGSLGRYGGTADLSVLDKVTEVRELNPDIEIGWDGGANETNAATLARSGIDVIDVGSAIAGADDPARAYATLETIVNKAE